MEPPFGRRFEFNDGLIRSAMTNPADVYKLYADVVDYLDYASDGYARHCRSPELAGEVFDHERARISFYAHATRTITIGRSCKPVDDQPRYTDLLEGMDVARKPGALLAVRLRFRVWTAMLSARRTAARRQAILKADNPLSTAPTYRRPSEFSEEELNWFRARLVILQDFEREVIRLRTVQGLTYEQIAKVLETTYDRVEKARRRAIRLMRAEALKAGLAESTDDEP